MEPSAIRTVRVGPRAIGPGQPVFIVAEVGINHDGDLDHAHRLVDAAADAGADAVKFQTIDPDASYTPGHPSYAVFKGKQFTLEQYRGLVAHAERRGVAFFTTPGDWPSLDLVGKLGLPLIKISSGLMTNEPLVLAAAEQRVPLVISTGMARLWEVARTVDQLEQRGHRDLVLLHCVSLYPAADHALGLPAIPLMQAAFPYPVGYSDHSLGNTACIAATALGARLLEKHLTLDRARPGADHHLSAEPDEFAALVREVRSVERMMARQGKAPHPEEEPRRAVYHRSLVANAPIAQGQPLTRALVGLRRSATHPGLPPELHDRVLGCRATRPIAKDAPITWDDITLH